MGLDMYLSARKYVPAMNWTDRNPNPEFAATLRATGSEGFVEEGNYSGISVKVPVMYWRKANAVHRWFVTECQGGIDECQETEVSRDKLIELRDLCQQVVDAKEKAPALLPTQSGFFFGGTEYDDYYLEDARYTAERLTQVLSLVGDDVLGWSFEYQSSW